MDVRILSNRVPRRGCFRGQMSLKEESNQLGARTGERLGRNRAKGVQGKSQKCLKRDSGWGCRKRGEVLIRPLALCFQSAYAFLISLTSQKDLVLYVLHRLRVIAISALRG